MKLQELLDSWYLPLKPILESADFKSIGAFLVKEQNEGRPVTPTFDNIFRAFKECPYHDLKVVIVGQDPYPGTVLPLNQVADGIAFSARTSPKPPKSLTYILKALEEDCFDGFDLNVSTMTDLTHWANQGILMLNTALTTQLGEIGKHMEIWKPFTTRLLTHLNDTHNGIVYVFLGKPAQKFIPLISETRNYILTASHPSHANYTGGTWEHGKLFSRVNTVLKDLNRFEVKWSNSTLVQ